MIVSRTPFRLPLGGGGTDLPSYYTKFGGSLLSVAINKYIYVIVNKNFDRSIKVSYRKIEEASNLDEVQHPIAREAMRLMGVTDLRSGRDMTVKETERPDCPREIAVRGAEPGRPDSWLRFPVSGDRSGGAA